MPDLTPRLSVALEGRYRVERELGEGGMATVYLAEDLKHRRNVALKVLKPELAAVVGAERFLAEIQVTANLQHPHILPLFDSGEAGGFLFYVMPYVEGETLRERVDREKQLPVDEAVRIAAAVANALDHAHRHGVIHRDIKPANILLQDGEPVVADFGIALAVGAAGGSRLTETGLSVGTPFYMSPEQATGDQTVGAPSDIYALGCVLFEMLVGEPPYLGNTAQAVLGKIIAGAPVEPTVQRSTIPTNVDAAIRCALEKLPADRFTTAQDFARALRDPGFRHGEAAAAAGGRWKAAALAGWAAAALLLVGFGWSALSPEPPGRVARYSVVPPEFARSATMALLPDGSGLVYEGVNEAGGAQLWLRRWADMEAAPVPGSANGFTPSLSPDGSELAYTDGNGILSVVGLEGGTPRRVAENAACCPTWSPDGTHLYYDAGQEGAWRVASGGGQSELVMRLDVEAGEQRLTFFKVLPGGDKAMVTVNLTGGDRRIDVVDLETGERTPLLTGTWAEYVDSGHLVFTTLEGMLMAVPFDSDRLEMRGTPMPIVEQIATIPSTTVPLVSISPTGQMVYRAGGEHAAFEVVWVDREGVLSQVDPAWTFFPGENNRGLSLSPDGTRLAISLLGEVREDVWIKELPRGPLTRLTFDEAQDVRPRWTPDGESISFISDRRGLNNGDVYLRRADGTGAAELLLDQEGSLWEAAWSPDQDWMIVRTGGALGQIGGRDILGLRPGTDSEPSPIVVSPFDEKAIALSPDGRWLAYESDESGRNEIYVRPFPDVDGGKYTVSTGGGIMPVWARSGRELFYVNQAREMVAAQLTTDPGFAVHDRPVLFTLDEQFLINENEQYALYDVSADDQRFITFRQVARAVPELIVVENFFEELRQRAGGD